MTISVCESLLQRDKMKIIGIKTIKAMQKQTAIQAQSISMPESKKLMISSEKNIGRSSYFVEKHIHSAQWSKGAGEKTYFLLFGVFGHYQTYWSR